MSKQQLVFEIPPLIEEYKLLTKGAINYDKLALYISTFHSTSIEGSTLTEKEVIDLLSMSKTSKKPFEHHLMVRDNFSALNFVIEKANQKAKMNLSLIQEINALVNKNTGSLVQTMNGNYDISKGEFRLSSVFVGKRMFPDAKKVSNLLQKMVDEINFKMAEKLSFEEKLKLSFYIHFEFVSIHPFGDGNGRTARLLMNFIQAYFQLPLSLVFKQDKIKYFDSLEKSREKESIEPFYNFMFQQYKKYLKQEIKVLKNN